MSETTPKSATNAPWDSPKGRTLAIILFIATSVVLLLGNLGGIGIWEPWEANEIMVAQEYATRGAPPEATDPKADSWNEVVPTFNGRPVQRSPLKTWLMAESIGDVTVDTTEIGELERRARLPMAFATLVFTLLGFAWLRRRFGVVRAAVASMTFVSIPATYIGVHNLTAEMLLVVTTSLALICFLEMTLDRERRLLWGLLFGGSLALGVFDQRLLSLYLPLLVISLFAVGEVVLSEAIRKRDGPSAPRRFGWIEVGGAVAALVAAGALVVWAQGTTPADDPEAKIPGYALQILGITLPVLLAFAGLWFGRKSQPGRAFFSLGGLLGTAVGTGAAVGLAYVYSDANPILLDHGSLFGDVRVFDFMLSNHLFERSIAEDHLTFDVVIRQAGFSLFPWVALLPLGFVYLARATRTVDEDGEELGARAFSEDLVTRRFLLVWLVGAALVIGVASAFDHYFYPAYFPIGAGIGLALTDRDFWARARRTPLAPYAIGFVAITLVLMLGKDLERFPARFIETYLSLQEGFEFPDGFSWGALYKPLKYALCLFLAAHFFGLVSWTVIALRKAKKTPQFLRAVKNRDWEAAFGTPSDVPPFVARLREKEQIRSGDGIVAWAARLVETPAGFGPLAAIVFSVAAGLFLFSFIPNVTNHLSQRGVFETYTRVADEGEKLLRYQVSARDNSVYLTDVEAIPGPSQLEAMFDQDERVFIVIPRKKLAAVNFEIRQRFKRNVYVLDDRSSRLLLISNKLEQGEEDKNYVADKIVDADADVDQLIDFPVEFESGGEMKHPIFDGQLEFLGYSLDHDKGKDGYVAYSWGETMTITYFFRVLKRVPSSQKIFLHVDYPGNRINGDHVPNGGEFPTNYWMPGDIVKDVHPLEIDSYSTPGIYGLHMGFFLGSRRMQVQPKEAHDGRNRITIGKIRVTSGL